MNLKRILHSAATLATLAALLLTTTMAWADNLVNNLDTTIDPALETATIPAGGSVTVGFYIKATTGGGDASGCNATGNEPAYLTITPPAGVSVSWQDYPNPLEFVGCENTKYVTFSSNTPGSYNITNFSMTGGKSDSQWNYETAKFTLVVQASDTTPPLISYTIGGTLGNNDWYTSDVTVTWTVVDNESAITSTSGCGPTTISSDTTGVTLTCSATSAGGTANQSVTIKRDATPPVINAALDKSPDSTGWFNSATGAPTVSFTCSDATSGLAGVCPADYTFGQGADQAYSQTIYDNAGNSATAGVSDIDVDLTAPSISVSVSPVPNDEGWNNSNVTVSFTCTDNLSGVASCPTDQSITTEGDNNSINASATDYAGNTLSITVSEIKIDKTAPTITATVSPTANPAGWNNTDVTVSFACSDGLSGIAFCTEDVTLSAEGAGQSVTGTAEDKAGNTASVTVSNINIDKTAPSITWNGGPVDGETYYFGSVPAAPTCTASDELSGLVGECTISGYSALVGTHTLTATATDKAGNTTTETRTYTVQAWTLRGFYQPVDMGGVYNTVKGGSTVPLKFEIFAGPTELTDTASVYSLKYGETPCNANAVTDEIETVATGGTSLRYDWTAGQFIFNWQTPRTAGKCYRVTMTAQDGSTLQALFKIK
jgi:hypothetical protein